MVLYWASKNWYAPPVARPRTFDESAVVRAARDAFWRTGYAGTSLEDLSAATGLGKGSLYNTFGGKEDLFRRSFSDYCEVSLAGVAARLAGPGRGLERILAYLDGFAAGTADDEDRVGCMLAKSTAELSSTSPEVMAEAHRTLQSIEELLARCIADAQQEGDLDPAADAEALAELLLTTTRGMEAVWKAGATPQSLRRTARTVAALLPRP